MWQKKYVQTHYTHKRVGKSTQMTSFSKILKCAHDGHFTIPGGHERGFFNGSEVTQLTQLIGHMIKKTWQMYYI